MLRGACSKSLLTYPYGRALGRVEENATLTTSARVTIQDRHPCPLRYDITYDDQPDPCEVE